MSGLTIRRAQAADAPALDRICLLTGDAGQSAVEILPPDAQESLSLLFALPYVDPALTEVTIRYVLARDDGDVIGYVLSAPDTRAFEERANKDYWPQLRKKYPLPAGVDITARDPWSGDDEGWESEGWPANSTVWSRRVVRLIHTAERSMAAQEAAIAFAPAHLSVPSPSLAYSL
jgi:hypothetical protein